MTDLNLPELLGKHTATLDSDLWHDRKRVAPESTPPERVQDIVFFAEDTWREVLQDLAYLTGPDGSLFDALQHFAAEAGRDPALWGFSRGITALRAIGARGAIEADDDLFAVDALIETLATLLALEGADIADPPDGGRPEMGAISVWSRIVQARLDRLGVLLHTGVGHPWSEEDEAALRRLDRLLGPPGAHALNDAPDGRLMSNLIGLSGDADAMIARLRQRDPGGFLVARSNAFPGNRDAFFDRLKIGNDGFFSIAPLVRFAPLVERLKQNDKIHLRIAKPLHRDADSAVSDDSNQLGLRLVQIKLWQRGHYADAIDSIFGPNTISAILEAVEIFGRQTSSAAVGDVLRRLGDGKIAINLHGLDRLVFSVKTESEFSPEAAELVAAAASEVVERRSPEEPDLDMKSPIVEAPILRSEDVHRARYGPLQGNKRGVVRLFRTVGRMVRSVVSALQRGLNNMVRAVDRMLSPVRDLMGVAFEQIEKARALLALALKTWRTFIFGKPLVIGTENDELVVARFSIDHDVRLIFVNNPPEAALDAYRKASNRLYRTLRIALNAGVTTINLLRALATWRGRIRLVFELSALLQRSVAQPKGRLLVAMI